MCVVPTYVALVHPMHPLTPPLLLVCLARQTYTTDDTFLCTRHYMWNLLHLPHHGLIWGWSLCDVVDPSSALAQSMGCGKPDGEAEAEASLPAPLVTLTYVEQVWGLCLSRDKHRWFLSYPG